MNALSTTLLEIVRTQDARHRALASSQDPTTRALYQAWLILTDTSEDAPRFELNDAISDAERIAKQGLGL